MTRPEDALERAREAAARGREEGRYEPEPAPGALEPTIVDELPAPELLREWAVIRVDEQAVYSTRRLGAPLTALKRLLLRLLRQYHIELEAQQTRSNIALLMRLDELEARLRRIERGAE